jgi:hypothetical protein
MEGPSFLEAGLGNLDALLTWFAEGTTVTRTIHMQTGNQVIKNED